MTAEEGLEALENAVVETARARAAEIAAAAQARAAQAVRRAQEAAAAERAQVLSGAQQEAARERLRAESAAHLEAQRRILAGREALIARVLEAARGQLEHGLAPRVRREALERALIDAAVALGGGHLTARTNPQDAPFLTPALLQGVAGRLAAQGIAAQFEPGPTAAILGGAIVTKDGGRIIIDHSFDAQLARLAWELRNEVWQVLGERVPEKEVVL